MTESVRKKRKKSEVEALLTAVFSSLGLTLRSVEGIQHVCKQRDESSASSCDSKEHHCKSCGKSNVVSCMMLQLIAAEVASSRGMNAELYNSMEKACLRCRVRHSKKYKEQIEVSEETAEETAEIPASDVTTTTAAVSHDCPVIPPPPL
jgi:hypothetical protein